MAEYTRDLTRFANEYPDFRWLHTYIRELGVSVPDIFPEPLNEARAEALASLLSTGNLEGAYMLGGYVLMHMVQQEYEQREEYEKCAAIKQMVEVQFRFIEPIHKLIRARHTEGASE